jgi:hypothetical protein
MERARTEYAQGKPRVCRQLARMKGLSLGIELPPSERCRPISKAGSTAVPLPCLKAILDHLQQGHALAPRDNENSDLISLRF